MKQKFISIVLVGLMILVLGGCGPKKDKINENANITEEKTKKSLKDIMTAGKPQKCNWSVNKENGKEKIEGLMYVSGKNFKQIITMNRTDGKKVETYVVGDDKWMYMWNSETPKKGVKIAIEENQKQSGGGSSGSVDWENKLNYQCSYWMESLLEFRLPNEIVFTDLAAEIEKMKQESGKNLDEMKKTVCEACDNAALESGRMACRENAQCE